MAARKKQSKIDPTKMVPRSKTQPTAAFTSPSKKPTSSRPRMASERPKEKKPTPIKKAESGFAGSGTPLNTSIGLSRPTAKKNVVNAGLTVAAVPMSAGLKAKIVSKVVSKSKIPGAAGNAAWDAAAKGLTKATGKGGKVSRSWTPMGPTLRSTRIGTPAQQSSRIENLMRNADRISNRAVAGAKTQIAKNTNRRINKTQQGAGIAVVASNKPKNNKSRTPKKK
jgi:hypothetical protein